jgi:hypothetical protein
VKLNREVTMTGKRLSLIILGSCAGLLIGLAIGQNVFALLAAVLSAGCTVLILTRPSTSRQVRSRERKDITAKRTSFVNALDRLLRMGKVTFDARYLQKFVHDAWPLIEEDPDALRWAKFFAASLKASCEETVAFGGNSVVLGSAAR